MTLSIQPLTDTAAINAILTTPAISCRIRHDAYTPGYIHHPALSYHGAYVDAVLSGLFMAIQHSPWEVEVHAALLPRVIRQARDLGALFLASLWDEQPDLQRITAPVLSTLPSAANYCRHLGFEDEGVRRNAVRVDGVLADVVYLGLLRPQDE